MNGKAGGFFTALGFDPAGLEIPACHNFYASISFNLD
jgi:hypothetical protein